MNCNHVFCYPYCTRFEPNCTNKCVSMQYPVGDKLVTGCCFFKENTLLNTGRDPNKPVKNEACNFTPENEEIPKHDVRINSEQYHNDHAIRFAEACLDNLREICKLSPSYEYSLAAMRVEEALLLIRERNRQRASDRGQW